MRVNFSVFFTKKRHYTAEFSRIFSKYSEWNAKCGHAPEELRETFVKFPGWDAKGGPTFI